LGVANESDRAHDVANGVLSRIAADGGPAWRVLEVVRSEERTPPYTDSAGVFHLRVTLGESPGGADNVAVYFTAGVPREEAIVATAGQIQDHAIEATHGSALPVCPGHRHPLQATVQDGQARWVCPRDPAYHSEPIVRAPVV
jgi:hypothetical protein